jgi:hypothetical protein
MNGTKPKSRFSRTPVKNRHGSTVAVPPHRLTELDLSILKTLAGHRVLSAEYLAALVGTSYKYAVYRLQILKSEPNCYVKVCDTQQENPKLHLYTPLFFELDSKGITELHERGVILPPRRPVRNLVHAVMVEQIMASFEIGGTLISRADILVSDKTPVRTRNHPAPDRIPLPKERYIRPDGEMFVIQSPSGFSFLPGIEADTGTEPVHSYDYERSSIKGKFEDYITIIENEIYKSHFGAKTFFIPFITPTTRRLASIMTLLEQMTEKKPSLRKSFLFKTHPLFTSSTKPVPSGHMITQPFQRVGYPPITFAE